MSKIFEYIGLISLVCFSFIVTEKTSTVAKNMDEIMINIKNNYTMYEEKPIDALINNNDIIIGNCGKYVDIDKSYLEMKKKGIYDDKLYQYKYVYPNMRLNNNYNKYIVGGSKNKNYIYIFIHINESNKFLLNNYEFANYNFIVNSNFYFNNYSLINKLINNNNSILIEETDFKDFKKISNHYKKNYNRTIYCYNKKNSDSFLELCSSNESGTIKNIVIYRNNYLYHLKVNLKNGNFYNFSLNKELINSVKIIENYLKQREIYKSNVDINLKEC